MDKLKIKDIIDTINSCFDGVIITESDADKKLDELYRFDRLYFNYR